MIKVYPAIIHEEDDKATYVATDVDEYRRDTQAVKKMISIPLWLAKEADARNISLSKITQKALQKELEMA